MSFRWNVADENRYFVDYAKKMSCCKWCGQLIVRGQLRMAMFQRGRFSDGDRYLEEDSPSYLRNRYTKLYHHPACLFQYFAQCSGGTKVVEEESEVIGLDSVLWTDRAAVEGMVHRQAELMEERTERTRAMSDGGDDDLFRTFAAVCEEASGRFTNEEKARALARILSGGSDGTGFRGDMYAWARLIAPGIKRVRAFGDRSLIRVLAVSMGRDADEALLDLRAATGWDDVYQLVSNLHSPDVAKGDQPVLTVREVDALLGRLARMPARSEVPAAAEEEVAEAAVRCRTPSELGTLSRLLRGDLRFSFGAEQLFVALEDGFPGGGLSGLRVFMSTRDVAAAVDKMMQERDELAAIAREVVGDGGDFGVFEQDSPGGHGGHGGHDGHDDGGVYELGSPGDDGGGGGVSEDDSPNDDGGSEGGGDKMDTS